MSYEEILNYWHTGNRPEKYVRGEQRSRLAAGLIYQVAPPPASVFEPGCNIGRNLHYLMELGYTDLTGIECAALPIKLGALYYPKMAETAKIYSDMVEDVLPHVPDLTFDATLSMAFLMHIPHEMNYILDELARVTKSVIVTLEDEIRSSGYRWFPRNYKDEFESRGFKQTFEMCCENIPSLNERFFIRRLEK